MFVLIVLLAGAVVGLLALGVLAYGLIGQIRRLQRAAAEAQRDLQPRLVALTPPPGDGGRHRAEPGA